MTKGFLKRKDRIILSAIDIINESGIQGLSTKALAKKEQMAESLLYKYFKSINDVVVDVIKYFAKYDVSIMNTIRKREVNNRDKIRGLVEVYAEYYDNYPAITGVLQNYETLYHEERTKNLIVNITSARFSFLVILIESGQEKGEISSKFTSEEMASIIIGLFEIVIQQWRMSDFSFRLKPRIVIPIEKILNE